MGKMSLALAVAPENALMSSFVVFRDKLETSMNTAADLGYDGVELALLNREQADVTSIQRIMKSRGLDIPMISTGQIFADAKVSFTNEDSSLRNAAVSSFIGLMELASELGSQINIGRLRGELKNRDTSLHLFFDSMETVLKRAEQLGVTIALEPVNRYECNFINSCSECAEIIESIGHRQLKMMPDVFHMNIEDASIEGSIHKYAEHISYIHFADSNRWAPGRGHLDFVSLIKSLREIQYEGFISLEILPFPDPHTAACEAIQHLRNFF